MRDVAVISWSGEDAMALTSLCSLSVCYPARPQAVQKVALALELPPRYLSFAVLFISLWKKQASLDNFFGKSVHVSILKTSRRRRLQLLIESNVEDRSVFRFPFLFGIASLQINIWSIRIHMYVCTWVFVCITLRVCKYANNYCLGMQ